MEYKHKLSTN